MVNKIVGIKARYARMGITVNNNDLNACILVAAPAEMAACLFQNKLISKERRQASHWHTSIRFSRVIIT
jgi:hypothetical protein